MEKKEIQNCRLCESIRDSRKQVVLGSGPIPAECMLVGEAPGYDEDSLGRPFIGRAGRILTEGLKDAGWDRKEIYITNLVKCRPVDEYGKNRMPYPVEKYNCVQWLYKEIEIVHPLVIGMLGAVPSNFLIGRTSLKDTRGMAKIMRIANWQGVVIGCYHPAAILYSPHLYQDFVNNLSLVYRMVQNRKKLKEG